MGKEGAVARGSPSVRPAVGLSGLRERRRRTCLVHIVVWRGVGNKKGLKILHVFISVDVSHVFASKLLKVERTQRTYCIVPGSLLCLMRDPSWK